VTIIGLPTVGQLAACAFSFGLPNMHDENRDNRAHNLILDEEDVFQPTVVVLGPAMGPGDGIDQLGGDANAISAPPYTALKHVVYPKFAPHLANIDCRALVLEAGIAGDD